MEEKSYSASIEKGEEKATCSTAFLLLPFSLRRPLFQLSSRLGFSFLLCLPSVSISHYLYLHSPMWLRPKSFLLKPKWPKYYQVDLLVNKSRGPCKFPKPTLLDLPVCAYVSHSWTAFMMYDTIYSLIIVIYYFWYFYVNKRYFRFR